MTTSPRLVPAALVGSDCSDRGRQFRRPRSAVGRTALEVHQHGTQQSREPRPAPARTGPRAGAAPAGAGRRGQRRRGPWPRSVRRTRRPRPSSGSAGARPGRGRSAGPAGWSSCPSRPGSRASELAGGQFVRRPGPAQRAEHVELVGLQVMLGERRPRSRSRCRASRVTRDSTDSGVTSRSGRSGCHAASSPSTSSRTPPG